MIGAVGLAGAVFVANKRTERLDGDYTGHLVVFALGVALGLIGVAAAPRVYRSGNQRAARLLGWSSTAVVFVGGMIGLGTVVGVLMVVASGFAALSALHLTWNLRP